MAFCSKCGATINAGDLSCNKCGAKVDVVEVTNSLISDVERKSREIAELKRQEIWDIVFSVFGLIITAIGLTIGLIERTGIEQDVLGMHFYKYHPYHNEALAMIVGGGFLVLVAVGIGFYYSIKSRRLQRELKSREDRSTM